MPPQLKVHLWRRIDRRLQRGEILITNEQFQEAMEKEFLKLLHIRPNGTIKALMSQMIVSVNETYPGTYLAMGIRNAVTRFFRDMQSSTGQDAKAQEETMEMIRRMIDEGRTAFFLESIGVEVGDSVPPKVQDAIERIINGQKLRTAPVQETAQQRTRKGPGMADLSVRTAKMETPPETDTGPAQSPLPTREEEETRTREEYLREKALLEQEMANASEYLEIYVSQDLLTEEEAEQLKELHSIDKRLEKGELDEEQAQRLRDKIDDAVRQRLEERLRAAIDYTVPFMNVFEALQHLPPERDDALGYLVRHKRLVVATEDDTDFTKAIEELAGDRPLAESVLTILERKDQEIRMLSANMPPYRRIIQPDERIENVLIEEEFVANLRALDVEGIAELLHSTDKEVCIKSAASIKCLVFLLNQVVQPTLFYKELRRLRLRIMLTDLYSGTEPKEGRRKVQHFLRRRLPSLFPEMTSNERLAVEEESKTIMEALDRGEEPTAAPPQPKGEGGTKVYRA